MYTSRQEVASTLTKTSKQTVGYIRGSKATQEITLESQDRKVRAMAVVHETELLEVITDSASGKSLDRPGVTRLLSLVDAGDVDTVIIAKLDRLTRSVRDLGDLLDRFERRGVTLISVAESLDTGSASGRLVLNIMASVAQWERETISERTREALATKRDDGERVGHVPYGSRLASDGVHLVPEASEQAVLARIRAARRQGVTFREISETLNESGLRTRTGAPWTISKVHQLARRAA